jgi:hypothetical protein
VDGPGLGYYRLWVLKGVLKIESKKSKENHQKIVKIVRILGLQIPTRNTISERNQLNEYPSYSATHQGEAVYSTSQECQF